MRKLTVFLLSALLVVGCSGGDGSSVTPPPSSCSNDGQKQFVLDALYDWYLWNDMLPANLDIADYATPEILATEVTETYGPQKAGGGPLDRFTSVGSLEADQQYFGEGKYEGFGFRFNFIDFLPPFQILGTFADSPAGASALERGQIVITLNGRTPEEIQAAEGVNTFFDDTDTVIFVVEDLLGNELPPIEITRGIVTIDPIPQWRTIDIGPGVPPVGYMQFESFVSTAEPVFNTVFAEFIAAGVKDVVIDMRYNGGGLVRTAELLGDYLGGFANDNLLFSSTEYNADRGPANNTSSFFSRVGNSIDLTRVIVIASRGTASASELVINAMDPYADVWIVGDNTFGKPVGQVGIDFCDKILRPTSFITSNADGFSDYFDGLPVDCPATDDAAIPVGAANDPNIIAATSISATGACPAAFAPEGAQAPRILRDTQYPYTRGATAAREYAGAY